MLDLDAHNVGVLCEAEHSIEVVEAALREARGDAGAGAIRVGIEHMHPGIVAQGVLDEHAAELAAAEERDQGVFRHACSPWLRKAARRRYPGGARGSALTQPVLAAAHAQQAVA